MKRTGRKLNGIFLLNKDSGMSSNKALQIAKRLFNAAKAGHTGSLDPLATGMLPICFGEATKFSQYLLDSNKSYRVVAKLGIRTSTQDAEGEIVEQRPVSVRPEQLAQALSQFRGVISQVPSMFSALKHQGQPLYKLARQGIDIERPARQVEVFRLEQILWEAERAELSLEVDCSKGTYIRSIVDDLGQVLGCGAHVQQLHRSRVAHYAEASMLSLAQAEQLLADGGVEALDAQLLPLDSAVRDWPQLDLSAEQSLALQQGKALQVELPPCSGWLRLFDVEQQRFFGIGQFNEQGLLVSRRLLAEDWA